MTDIAQELARLRYLWGGAYRITWHGRFHATYIDSGSTLNADTAAELRRQLLAHHNQRLLTFAQPAHETSEPPDCGGVQQHSTETLLAATQSQRRI